VIDQKVVQKYSDNYAEKNWRFHGHKWKPPTKIAKDEQKAKSKKPKRVKKVSKKDQIREMFQEFPDCFESLESECGSD
jgi:hypothetical protein